MVESLLKQFVEIDNFLEMAIVDDFLSKNYDISKQLDWLNKIKDHHGNLNT